MSENRATIVIDADDASLIAKSLQARKNLTESARSAASGWDKATQAVGRQLLTVGALAKAITGVVNAVDKVGSAAGQLSKTTGGRGLLSELAGQKLGLSSIQVQAITGGSSSRSEEEMAGFLQALAGTKGPGGRAISTRDAARAATLFGSGVIDQSEITKAISERGGAGISGLQRQVGSRMSGLSERARMELELRRVENDEARRISATDRDIGASRRVADARLARMRAENPYAFAFVDTASGIPLLGEAVQPGINTTMQMQTSLEGIRANTAPRLNATGNGP